MIEVKGYGEIGTEFCCTAKADLGAGAFFPTVEGDTTTLQVLSDEGPTATGTTRWYRVRVVDGALGAEAALATYRRQFPL